MYLWTCGTFGFVDLWDLWTCGTCGTCGFCGLEGLVGLVDLWDLFTCGLVGLLDLWTCGLVGLVDMWTCGHVGLVDLWTCELVICGLGRTASSFTTEGTTLSMQDRTVATSNGLRVPSPQRAPLYLCRTVWWRQLCTEGVVAMYSSYVLRLQRPCISSCVQGEQ